MLIRHRLVLDIDYTMFGKELYYSYTQELESAVQCSPSDVGNSWNKTQLWKIGGTHNLNPEVLSSTVVPAVEPHALHTLS